MSNWLNELEKLVNDADYAEMTEGGFNVFLRGAGGLVDREISRRYTSARDAKALTDQNILCKRFDADTMPSVLLYNTRQRWREDEVGEVRCLEKRAKTTRGIMRIINPNTSPFIIPGSPVHIYKYVQFYNTLCDTNTVLEPEPVRGVRSEYPAWAREYYWLRHGSVPFEDHASYERWRGWFFGQVGKGLYTTSSRREAATLLGIDPWASRQEVKTAWKKYAQEHHPDRPGGDAVVFKRGQEAYEALT